MTKLPAHLKIGDTVYSVYDDMRGKIVEIVSTSGLQDEYLIQWRDGIVSNAFREEVY